MFVLDLRGKGASSMVNAVYGQADKVPEDFISILQNFTK